MYKRTLALQSHPLALKYNLKYYWKRTAARSMAKDIFCRTRPLQTPKGPSPNYRRISMIIEKVLKKLTPERIKLEVSMTQRVELPVNLEKWVREYEKIGKRDDFFWKFIYKLNLKVNLFGVSGLHKSDELKFLMTMYIILVDDIVDKKQDKNLLEAFLKINGSRQDKLIFKSFKTPQKEGLEFTSKLLGYMQEKIKKLPGYKSFYELLRYDISQTLNAMNYAFLINKNPYLINKVEHWLYSPHTLQGMINCTLDLMCFSRFHFKQLGKIREIFWNAQKMARISNCLATWEREVNEKDVTSSVFVYAVDRQLLSIKDFSGTRGKRDQLIARIGHSSISKELLKEWENCHHAISLHKRTEGTNVKEFLVAMEEILLMHLSVKKEYNQ